MFQEHVFWEKHKASKKPNHGTNRLRTRRFSVHKCVCVCGLSPADGGRRSTYMHSIYTPFDTPYAAVVSYAKKTSTKYLYIHTTCCNTAVVLLVLLCSPHTRTGKVKVYGIYKAVLALARAPTACLLLLLFWGRAVNPFHFEKKKRRPRNTFTHYIRKEQDKIICNTTAAVSSVDPRGEKMAKTTYW